MNDDRQDEFVSLLTEHQQALFAYITSLMPGVPGINDVLQETNITLWQKREKFRSGSNFTAWSFAVARFSVLEHRRKSRRQEHLYFSDELSELLAYSPQDLVPERVEARSKALHACMEKLSSAHRELVRLRYESKVSLEQFAHDNGRSAGSIRVTLHKIRTNLRRCINFQLAQEATSE